MVGMSIFNYNFSSKCAKYIVTLSLSVILKLLPTKLWMSQRQC